MVMQMRKDKCYPGRGKWMKIPLLLENVGKMSLNYLGTLERVTTISIKVSVANFEVKMLVAEIKQNNTASKI